MKYIASFISIFLLIFVSGIVGYDNPTNNSQSNSSSKNQHSHKDHNHKKWCEHGFEKGNCYRCEPKLAEKFKKSGDWCGGHNVPESQCFPCNSGLQEKVNKRLAQNKHDGHDHKDHDHEHKDHDHDK